MNKEERLKINKDKWHKMREHELELHDKGMRYIGGIDEVGRGPLAGPVVSACVILPRDCEILGVDDSKKLSEKKRNELDKIIREKAISVGIGIATNEEIDEINILNATKLAMKRAVINASVDVKPDILLIDAIKLDDVDVVQESIVKGDEKYASVASASIVAKVARDSYMVKMDEKYPGYSFKSNKGYGTRAHYEGISSLGICPIHRKTFLKTAEKNINKIKMKKKYYAVKNGRNNGIYDTWDECKKEVDGYKGAKYKSFGTLDEAKEYLGAIEVKENIGYEAYVDGSYDEATGRYSGAAIIIHNNEVVKEIAKSFSDDEDGKLRNVSGEIEGSILAIDYALNNGIEEISIFHDYSGIGKWADDEWKANLPKTMRYKEYVRESRKNLKINFIKVKGHSGNKYNEMADKLARDVLK